MWKKILMASSSEVPFINTWVGCHFTVHLKVMILGIVPSHRVGCFMVVVHCNNSIQIEMSLHSDTLYWLRANKSLFLQISLHSDTLYWLRANQSLLLRLNFAFLLVEKQQIPNLIVFDLIWRDWTPGLPVLEMKMLPVTPLRWLISCCNALILFNYNV